MKVLERQGSGKSNVGHDSLDTMSYKKCRRKRQYQNMSRIEYKKETVQ